MGHSSREASESRVPVQMAAPQPNSLRLWRRRNTIYVDFSPPRRCRNTIYGGFARKFLPLSRLWYL